MALGARREGARQCHGTLEHAAGSQQCPLAGPLPGKGTRVTQRVTHPAQPQAATERWLQSGFRLTPESLSRLLAPGWGPLRPRVALTRCQQRCHRCPCPAHLLKHSASLPAPRCCQNCCSAAPEGEQEKLAGHGRCHPARGTERWHLEPFPGGHGREGAQGRQSPGAEPGIAALIGASAAQGFSHLGAAPGGFVPVGIKLQARVWGGGVWLLGFAHLAEPEPEPGLLPPLLVPGEHRSRLPGSAIPGSHGLMSTKHQTRSVWRGKSLQKWDFGTQAAQAAECSASLLLPDGPGPVLLPAQLHDLPVPVTCHTSLSPVTHPCQHPRALGNTRNLFREYFPSLFPPCLQPRGLEQGVG